MDINIANFTPNQYHPTAENPKISKFYALIPQKLNECHIHIIGCGAVGTHIAYLLAKYSATTFALYDDDVVESKNLGNQMYKETDVGKDKTFVGAEIIKNNSTGTSLSVNLYNKKVKRLGDLHNNPLKPLKVIFLSVDSLESRLDILKSRHLNRKKIDYSNYIIIDTGINSTKYRAHIVTHIEGETRLLNRLISSEAINPTPNPPCGKEGDILTSMATSQAAVTLLLQDLRKRGEEATTSRIIRIEGDTADNTILNIKEEPRWTN